MHACTRSPVLSDNCARLLLQGKNQSFKHCVYSAAKGSAFATPLHACCHVQDAGALALYKQAELIHCHLAMTAVGHLNLAQS